MYACMHVYMSVCKHACMYDCMSSRELEEEEDIARDGFRLWKIGA